MMVFVVVRCILTNTAAFYIVTCTICKELFFKYRYFMLYSLNCFFACLKSFTAMGCISNCNDCCFTDI
ncbi:Uncharacterised protein [Acinetobacter baumannii]|nr:Uncharacterised protein [Acinetobacter baumannii]